MGLRRDPRAKVELGDYQTPPELAADVCRLLKARGVAPRLIVEPTCGVGNLLLAALAAFPAHEAAVGLEINERHVAALAGRLAHLDAPRATVELGSFFAVDWPARLAAADPILVIGNPPWVTSADLGALNSRNRPDRASFRGRHGLDAVTGKSNFDISESMIGQLLGWLDGRTATLAMLCKTAVARKALAAAWTAGYQLRAAATYAIDSAKHFGAAVDACLLICELAPGAATAQCATYDSLTAITPTGLLGMADGALLANVALYQRHRSLSGESPHRWRSGIKHDCAAVMELRRSGERYENGAGERVALEPDFVYPMLKSSDVAKGESPSRFMIVPQTHIGEDTAAIADTAPATWAYLVRHRPRFDRRGSSIYNGKPPFSIFGVGPYTFAPWKVAISGLYKKLEFRVVGPHQGRPVVLDDTCYFLACTTEAEARLLATLLSSPPAQEFYAAFVFWDAKRPITTELLRRLDLRRLGA